MKTLTKAEYDALCLQHMSVHGGLGFGGLRKESLENILKVTLKATDDYAYTLDVEDRESILKWLKDGYALTEWYYYNQRELAIYFDLPKVWEYHQQQINAKAQAEAAAERLKNTAQDLFDVEIMASKVNTTPKAVEVQAPELQLPTVIEAEEDPRKEIDDETF